MFARIGYLNVKVTSEEIQELKEAANDLNNPNQRLSIMKLGFVRDLDRMQKSGFHTTYIEEGDQIVCTCGLTLLDQRSRFEGETDFLDYLDKDLLAKYPQIEADQIHTVRGHQRLPSCTDKAVALIHELKWNDHLHEFLYKAFCQECMQQISGVQGKDARKFVRVHNKSCGRFKPGEGGS
jgi:hypothetical protein